MVVSALVYAEGLLEHWDFNRTVKICKCNEANAFMVHLKRFIFRGMCTKSQLWHLNAKRMFAVLHTSFMVMSHIKYIKKTYQSVLA